MYRNPLLGNVPYMDGTERHIAWSVPYLVRGLGHFVEPLKLTRGQKERRAGTNKGWSVEIPIQ